MKPAIDFDEGNMFLMDKPKGLTSFDVVKKIRHLTKAKKVGHAGTLDPLATGLLIVCTGKFTKNLNQYMGLDKTYSGTITIGSTTESFDLEKPQENFQSYDHISNEDITDKTKMFTGEILQLPPQHSAVKKNGKPIYLSARKGIEVEIEPRKVRIEYFKIINISLPVISFEIKCSTGTYIRSLANDFGASLGVGGFLSSLRRTQIGEYYVDTAYSIERFSSYLESLKSLST